MADLLQLKISTGEWLIGEGQQTLQEDPFITLKKPLVIHIVPQGDTSYGIALIPFDPANPEGTVEIFRSAIVARPLSIAKGLHDAYIQRTTGLEIVSNIPEDSPIVKEAQ